MGDFNLFKNSETIINTGTPDQKNNQTEEAEPQQEEKIDMQKLDGKERIALLKKRKEDMKAKM